MTNAAAGAASSNVVQEVTVGDKSRVTRNIVEANTVKIPKYQGIAKARTW